MVPHLRREPVVQLLQELPGVLVVADLEELDPDLPGDGLAPVAVEPLGGSHDDALRVVGELTVRDGDDVERAHGEGRVAELAVFICRGGHGLDALQVGPQDLVQALPEGRAAGRADAPEDLLDGRGRGDVRVGPGIAVAASMVQKVDVDAVGVVLDADGRDGGDRVFGLLPPRSLHAQAIVDHEDGVEFREEGVGRIAAGARLIGRGRRGWRWRRRRSFRVRRGRPEAVALVLASKTSKRVAGKAHIRASCA